MALLLALAVVSVQYLQSAGQQSQLLKQVSGDVSVQCDISPGVKNSITLAQSEKAKSPFAKIETDNRGLLVQTFREKFNEKTRVIRSRIPLASKIRLERRGKYVYGFAYSAKDQEWIFAGSMMRVELPKLLVASSGQSNKSLSIETPDDFAIRRYSTLETINILSNERTVVQVFQIDIQAPNWSPDGKNFYYNFLGKLYRLPTSGGNPTQIETGSITQCNNDHGISPDGKWLALSNQSNPNESQIYVVPCGGGLPRQVTKPGASYWHGWSPNGKAITFCGKRDGKFGIFTISADGTNERRITTATNLDDGPEFASDGKFIYFNSDRRGSMQIYKVSLDGKQLKQITFDSFNNWFPHPSPDGKWLAFLSYGKGTVGHPADQDVAIRLYNLKTKAIRVLARIRGGQGTLNVPSWSPNSKSLAMISYQLAP